MESSRLYSSSKSTSDPARSPTCLCSLKCLAQVASSRGFLSLSHAGSHWVLCGSSRSPMQCKVDSRWTPGGFAAVPCGFGFWVGSEMRWAASCRHTHQKKQRTRNNLKWGAQSSGDCVSCVLGGPKLAASTVTHIERKLAPTISPASAILAILVPEKLDATCRLPAKLALMTFELRSKNWFRRQSLPSSQECAWPQLSGRWPNRSVTGTAKTRRLTCSQNPFLESASAPKNIPPVESHFGIQNLAPKMGPLKRRNVFAALGPTNVVFPTFFWALSACTCNALRHGQACWSKLARYLL